MAYVRRGFGENFDVPLPPDMTTYDVPMPPVTPPTTTTGSDASTGGGFWSQLGTTLIGVGAAYVKSTTATPATTKGAVVGNRVSPLGKSSTSNMLLIGLVGAAGIAAFMLLGKKRR
jgi:hypothetical protein